MFSSGMAESTASAITLPDVRYPVFLALCEYLYTDQMHHAEFAMELLLESEKMSLTRLSALCQSVLEEGIDTHSVTTIFDAADTYGATALRKVCLDYILEKFTEVSTTDGFVSLREGLLREVLRCRANPGAPPPPIFPQSRSSFDRPEFSNELLVTANFPSEPSHHNNVERASSIIVNGGGSTLSGVNGGGDRVGNASSVALSQPVRGRLREDEIGGTFPVASTSVVVAPTSATAPSRKRTLVQQGSPRGTPVRVGSNLNYDIPSAYGSSSASNKRHRPSIVETTSIIPPVVVSSGAPGIQPFQLGNEDEGSRGSVEEREADGEVESAEGDDAHT